MTTTLDDAAIATTPIVTRRSGRFRAAGLAVVGIAILVVIGQVAPPLTGISPDSLPTSSAVFAALGGLVVSGGLWQPVLDTLGVWAIGVSIASIAALVIGMLIGSLPVVRRLTSGVIELLRPIPSVALLPLAVLLYGTRMGSSLLLIVFTCFWQMLIQVIAGVVDVDPVARDVTRSYRFGPAGRIRHLVLPTLLPYFVTGLRLAATLGLAVAVTVEMIVGAPGIGSSIASSQSANLAATAYAWVIVAGMLGLAINLGIRAAERRLLRWHPSMRKEVSA